MLVCKSSKRNSDKNITGCAQLLQLGLSVHASSAGSGDVRQQRKWVRYVELKNAKRGAVMRRTCMLLGKRGS